MFAVIELLRLNFIVHQWGWGKLSDVIIVIIRPRVSSSTFITPAFKCCDLFVGVGRRKTA